MKRARLPALCLGAALLCACLSGCLAGEPVPSAASAAPEPAPSAQPSQPEPTPTVGPVPAVSPAPVPIQPTAELLGLTGLDAALFDGAYAAYFGQEYVSSFEEFPRVVLPQANLLGSYEGDGVTYYVCNVGFAIHYYEPETGTFDDAAGALLAPCRIALADGGGGTYEFQEALLPPDGAGYGPAVTEIFGPLEDLYRAYMGDSGTPPEPIRTSLTADEMWALYIQAAGI